MQPHLALRGLRKTFGHTVAVDGLDLDVGPGEFVALLGPSGCGKTTSLRKVAGFERPDRGEVLIQGLPVTDKPPYRRDVGIVFQSYALFPHMTVAERRLRAPDAEGPRLERVARVAAALDLARLSGLDARYPASSRAGSSSVSRWRGHRDPPVRPAVRRAPLESGRAPPPSHAGRAARTAADAAHRHDPRDARPGRGAQPGRPHRGHARGAREQVGTPEAIYAGPATPFVAEFIGQCNFLSGHVHAPDGMAPIFRADDGLTFPLAPSASLSHAQRGTVALRPEAIALLGLDETPAPGATVIDAVVQRVTYLGALRQYRVTTEARTELRVDCQVGPLGTHAGH